MKLFNAEPLDFEKKGAEILRLFSFSGLLFCPHRIIAGRFAVMLCKSSFFSV